MNKYGELAARLASAADVERRLTELYRRAGDEARNKETAQVLHGLAHRHQSHHERVEHARERVQERRGEGLIGKTLESIGTGFAGFVDSFSSTLIRAETHATLDTFKRYETRLRDEYRAMAELGSADEEIRTMLQSFADDTQHSLDRLAAIDPLT